MTVFPNDVATQIQPMTQFEKVSGLAQKERQMPKFGGYVRKTRLVSLVFPLNYFPHRQDSVRTSILAAFPTYSTDTGVCLVAEPPAFLINMHSNKLHHQSSSDKVQVCVLVHAVVAFVLLEQVAELVHVQLVQGIQFLGRRLPVPLHPNWPSDCREVTR